jgi:hypothetical protein
MVIFMVSTPMEFTPKPFQLPSAFYYPVFWPKHVRC